jgi:hypothetical protein
MKTFGLEIDLKERCVLTAVHHSKYNTITLLVLTPTKIKQYRIVSLKQLQLINEFNQIIKFSSRNDKILMEIGGNKFSTKISRNLKSFIKKLKQMSIKPTHTGCLKPIDELALQSDLQRPIMAVTEQPTHTGCLKPIDELALQSDLQRPIMAVTEQPTHTGCLKPIDELALQSDLQRPNKKDLAVQPIETRNHDAKSIDPSSKPNHELLPEISNPFILNGSLLTHSIKSTKLQYCAKELRKSQSEYTSYSPLKVFCGSWNVAGQLPSENIQSWFIKNLDLYVLGTL